MSTKINKGRFLELLRTLIKKEIDEASTTASAGVDYGGSGTYDTPHWGAGKGKNRRKSIASGSGYHEVTEDTKDKIKAKKLERTLGNIEGKYRHAMYQLSDRLQADIKNHSLQKELVKSYTKNVTSFMRDMVKITKRVK
jgi:hypothetical protein|tara:strand:+ start:533 stop:949 length:417 start_codon:yes stop_codon:yes gene_type:complete